MSNYSKEKKEWNKFYCHTKYVLELLMKTNENGSNEKYKTKF